MFRPRSKREIAKAQALERVTKLIVEIAAPDPHAWTSIKTNLNRLPAPVLHRLAYRIEQAMRQSFEEGLMRGHALGARGEPLPKGDPL